jgi:hypothetical protein
MTTIDDYMFHEIDFYTTKEVQDLIFHLIGVAQLWKTSETFCLEFKFFMPLNKKSEKVLLDGMEIIKRTRAQLPIKP